MWSQRGRESGSHNQGARESGSQRVRGSESQGVSIVSIGKELPVSGDCTIERVSLNWRVRESESQSQGVKEFNIQRVRVRKSPELL